MTNPDAPRLQGLSAADTRWLVAEARRVLCDLGHTSTVVDGVALQLPDDRVMGLDNLARTVRLLPRKRWGRAVRDQLTALVDIRPDERVDPADLLAKLLPSEQAEDFVAYDALEPLPGVVGVLARQGERTCQVFGRLDTVGDRDEAYDAALANLAALPLPRHTRRRVDPDEPESWVEFLDSPGSFGASRVLVLPDLLRRLLRRDFPAHGVLVAVPTQHELWVHVPIGESVVPTALAMAWLAHRTWSEEPYPISPDVFLVSPDMHAVTLVRPTRNQVDLDRRAMVELLEALEGPDHGRAAS